MRKDQETASADIPRKSTQLDDQWETTDNSESQDPRIVAANGRWKEFKAQDYEGRIALFIETSNDSELMDSELAFDMLRVLYNDTIERSERERFIRLVELLRERMPSVYSEEEPYYLKWCIANVGATGQIEALPTLINKMALVAEKDIDLFNHVLDQLAYHGELSMLVNAMHTAWPFVKDAVASSSPGGLMSSEIEQAVM